ncbi:MAG: hypothetical protein ACI4MF_11540 [Candidatus Faecivicinus sp.]
MKKARRPLSTFSKVMMIAIGATSMLLIATTLLEQNGIRLLAMPELNFLGCVVIIVELLIWGAVSISRRIRGKNGKLVFNLIAVLVIMMVGMFLSTYIMQFGQLTLPHAYGTIQSPAGRKVVIVNSVDTGMNGDGDFAAMLARMDERVAYIEASATPAPAEGEVSDAEATAEPAAEATAEPDANDAAVLDSYPYGAYGYVYCAYPRVMGIFYNMNVSVEGLIYRGCESQARLCYEWLDDTTVRFYLEDAEPGDSGEILLSF